MYKLLYEKGIITPESYIEDLSQNAIAMIRVGARNGDLSVKNGMTIYLIINIIE